MLFFATLAAFRVVDLPASTVWAVGGGLAVACVVVAGVVRRPGGLVVGTLLQVVVLAGGFWLPALFLMGAVFAALWLWLLRVGRRIDRETREREALQ